MRLNNGWVKNEIKEEIKRFLEMSDNKYTRVLYLWDTAKEVLTGKLVDIQAYIKEIEIFQKQNNTKQPPQKKPQPHIYKNLKNNNRKSPEGVGGRK